MSETDVNARFEALEVRIAYQERTIEDLSTTVAEQWRQIDQLAKQVERMTDRLRSVEASVPPSGEPEPPPPHY